VVEYKGFLYQAASWKKARRVVAKVERHAWEYSRGWATLPSRAWCGSTTIADIGAVDQGSQASSEG